MGKNQNARHAVGSLAFLVARTKSNNMSIWWNRGKILMIVSLFLFLVHGMTELAYLQQMEKGSIALAKISRFRNLFSSSANPFKLPLTVLPSIAITKSCFAQSGTRRNLYFDIRTS